MKLIIDEKRSQPDPYVIKAESAYYMYSTGKDGIQLYVSDDKFNWTYKGICFSRAGHKEFWAPCVSEYKGKYYMYFSCMPESSTDVHEERMCVAVSDLPQGPFEFVRELILPFSIDPHVVESGGELYMFYSVNDYEAERAGTLIVVDKMKSATETCGQPKAVLRATLDEEIYMRDRFKKGQHWHTLEGSFYFRKGDYHYLMYSGNCFENEYYYVGYAVCKSEESDLTKLTFKKYPDEKTYCPLLSKNDEEEGTGHNSVLCENGRYFVYYHGRDWNNRSLTDSRTARICEISVNEGVLSVLKR